jgi:hypothetical protein
MPKQLEQKGKPDARNSGLAIDTTSVPKGFKSIKDPSYKPSTKKYKSGGSLGMKSVKAGFDKNPGVTRADIIVAAKKKAQDGKTLPIKKSKTSEYKSNPGFELQLQKFKHKQRMDMMKLDKERKERKVREASYQQPEGTTIKKAKYKTGGVVKKMKNSGSVKKCKYGCK